jgi:hypothetical protein
MSEKNNKWKCGCSKEQLQKELTKAEDWEIKKKEKLKEILVSDKSPYWYCNGEEGEKHYLTDYPKPWGSFGTSFIQCSHGCGKIGKKINEFMDELELEHECKAEANPELDSSNQIKSNQIKSNQIKSNQIKSNQIKSNQINCRMLQAKILSKLIIYPIF